MNIDMQSYLDALQSTQFSKELINQGLEMAQQKREETTLPISELSLGEGIKSLGEQAFSYVKQQGTQMVKDALRSKMKDAGIDDETINSTLEGDLNLETLTSKVGSLITKAKSTAQDLVSQAQSKVEGVVSDIQSQAQDLVGQAQTQAEGLVDQVQSQVEGLGQTLTDSLDNITSTVRSNISDAQGIADDLTSQAMQEYNVASRIGEPTLMEAETGTSNIVSRISNFFQSPQPQPQDIEMVDFSDLAPEVSSTIAPELSSTIAPAINDLVSTGSNIASGLSDAVSGAIGGVSEAVSGATGAIEGTVGALEGIGAGLDMSGALAPIGAILGIVGGIVGIFEGEKSPQEQAPILNPSSQFL